MAIASGYMQSKRMLLAVFSSLASEKEEEVQDVVVHEVGIV